MRSIGSLDDRQLADRLVAFLSVEGIGAEAEESDSKWLIWIKDEDKLDEARSLMSEFESEPGNPRYSAAVEEADRLKKKEEARRREVAKRVVDVRGRWQQGTAGAGRLTKLVIGLCVIATILGGFVNSSDNTVVRSLSFCDTMQLPDWQAESLSDRLVDIRRGQIWRLITPVFLHGDIFHLLMNMYVFYLFAGQIELRRGTGMLAWLIFFTGLTSCVVQALVPTAIGGSVFSVGLSGVGYGLAGYIWTSMQVDSRSDLFITRGWWTILLVWLLLGIAGVLDAMGLHVANWAHGIGLVAGMFVAFAAVQLRQKKTSK